MRLSLPVVFLVLANLLPLTGVLLLGWSVLVAVRLLENMASNSANASSTPNVLLTSWRAFSAPSFGFARRRREPKSRNRRLLRQGSTRDMKDAGSFDRWV